MAEKYAIGEEHIIHGQSALTSHSTPFQEFAVSKTSLSTALLMLLAIDWRVTLTMESKKNASGIWRELLSLVPHTCSFAAPLNMQEENEFEGVVRWVDIEADKGNLMASVEMKAFFGSAVPGDKWPTKRIAITDIMQVIWCLDDPKKVASLCFGLASAIESCLLQRKVARIPRNHYSKSSGETVNLKVDL